MFLMSDDAGCGNSYSLKYVSDCFVMQELVEMWHDDYYGYKTTQAMDDKELLHVGYDSS